MSSDSNKELIRTGYDAFNRQDIPTVLGLLDEHVAWTEPEWTYGPVNEGTVYGLDEVLHKVFEPIGEYYDSFQVEPRQLYADGETVIAEGSFRLRPKGVSDLLEVPFTHVWRFRDGKAVSMRNYIDIEQLYERRELRRTA